jgi:integrase
MTEHWFTKQLLTDSKAAEPASLHPDQADLFRQVLRDEEYFSSKTTGNRDRLILELLDQGMRAGEILKIRGTDIDEAYRIDRSSTRGIVTITRRPNDLDDERLVEPAVKTNPGKLPVPSRLAAALIRYVIGERRVAIDARSDEIETPYLFVNHEGKFTGQPLSQRNLNRIVAKLKGRFGLPEEFVPHTLRHTHMTELYDALRTKGLKDEDIQSRMVQRGRWAPNSKMPAHYASRSLIREAADYIEERDRKLQDA